MGRFAPVAPIQILEEMDKEDILGDYHLLLAHHILEHPERFRELFRTGSSWLYEKRTVIVDNSLVELGSAQNEQMVWEACQNISNPIPVLTDVMGEGHATRILGTESYYKWQQLAKNQHPLMVVLQGNCWYDFCATAEHFLLGDFPAIKWVGIPRILVGCLKTRWHAIEYVRALRPDINIHLLGFNDWNVPDDIICARHPEVRGIDTAVPLRYSFELPEGVSPIFTPTCEIPKRPPDWFEKGVLDVATKQNLWNIRKWVGDSSI